jgi:hypothetical protein
MRRWTKQRGQIVREHRRSAPAWRAGGFSVDGAQAWRRRAPSAGKLFALPVLRWPGQSAETRAEDRAGLTGGVITGAQVSPSGGFAGDNEREAVAGRMYPHAV